MKFQSNNKNHDILTNEFLKSNSDQKIIDEILHQVRYGDNGINDIFNTVINSGYVSSTVIKRLIDLDSESKYYINVLDYCFGHNDADLAKYLIENTNVKITSYVIGSPKVRYADHDCYEFIEMLLTYDIEVVLSEKMLAYVSDKPNILSLLLKYSTNIEPIFSFYHRYGYLSIEVIEILLNEIIRLKNKNDQKNINYFLCYVYCKNILTLNHIKLLVDSGVDPRYCGDNLFITSCRYGDIETIKYFLYECGCDVNSNNSKALINAMIMERYDIAKFLIDFRIKISDDVIIASVNNPKNLMLLLDNDISAESIAKIIWSNISRIKRPMDEFAVYCKELVSHGVDFNQIISG